MNRRDANVLRAFGIWTIYVWVTRMWNIWRDEERGTGFKVVHTALAVVSVALAVACLSIVGRIRGRRSGSDRSGPLASDAVPSGR